ncbi:hypothetical protein [Mycobacteroides chelonae]|uniref:hypothetical protein n=1 Tax=Mycobacteroides chelonae TaxID=1774 RepID=UPI000991F8A3|nr:hypothetical protein [Mycobacteroides chelonae]
MYTLDRVNVVGIALRISLATAFLSAVADRFGWWAPLGQGSWGSMGAFTAYTHQLIPFASGWLLSVIVWASTAAEVIVAVLLLIGLEALFSYSVFSAASAGAAYAILGTRSPSC